MQKELAPQKGFIKTSYRHHVSLRHPIVFQPHSTLADYCRWFQINQKDLEKLDLTYLPLDTPMAVLSGGERVRVALTLLLTQHVDVYFFDEPCSGLNEKHQRMVVSWILEVSQHTTCVIASHRTIWIPWAYSHVQLNEGGFSDITIHRTSPIQKPHLKLRCFQPKPRMKRLFQHQNTSLFGLMLSMILTLSLASAALWMNHLPSRHARQLNRLSMVTLETVERVELESSPYVLTKTSPIDQGAMQTLFRSFLEIVIDLDFRSLFALDIHGDHGTYAIEWVLDSYSRIQEVDVYGQDRIVDVLITPLEQSVDCLCSMTLTLTARHYYPLESPFDIPTVFLSYPVWKTWFMDHYADVMASQVDGQEEITSHVLWGVFLDFSTYQFLKRSLREGGYRLYNGWYDRMQTLVELFSTLTFWNLLFLLLSVGTTVLLEVQRLAVFMTLNQHKIDHWIDFGASQRRLYDAYVSPFYVISDGVGFIAVSVWVWLWVQGNIALHFLISVLVLNLTLVLTILVLMAGYHHMVEKRKRHDYL